MDYIKIDKEEKLGTYFKYIFFLEKLSSVLL